MSGNRIETICDLLQQGLTAEEIEAELAHRRARLLLPRELRGKESELIAFSYLKELNFVSKAQLLSDNPDQDNEKHDLMVCLKPKVFKQEFSSPLVIPGCFVWLQVKSSVQYPIFQELIL